MCECGETSGGKEPWTVNIYEEWPTAGYIEPICMGALISHHHILTSKLCFGVRMGQTFTSGELHSIRNKIKVMLGADDSFPDGFPHSTDLTVELNDLKRKGIVLNGIEEVLDNQNDEFCILTMHDYIEFTDNIRPLCLPKDPNHFHRTGPNDVDFFGYGYTDSASPFILAARHDKQSGREMKFSRRRFHAARQTVIPRKACSTRQYASTLKMYD